MPIYEYIASSPDNSCPYCRFGFETVQKISEATLTGCPECGQPVRRQVSLCHAAIMETSPESKQVESQIREYEKAGQWSHAAELADSHSEKTKDSDLKTRALDNYKKAGYDSGLLSKHDKS